MLNDGKIHTMSLEVEQFLNDSGGNFTETAPRPPVPGEENELHSNGGTSTRSSGSHKSHLSGKSHSSNKSVGSHRTEHSPAATPRRSNLDKTGNFTNFQKGNGTEVEAPLGFEPEGSAASSPPFTENSTPPYLKWASNIRYLLEDSDGVKLFKQFLDQEQCSNQLDFWFACRGLKMVGTSDRQKIHSLIKLIYKKYLKGDQLILSPKARKNIADQIIKPECSDQSIFDEAQQEIEDCMRNDTYPLFLKSDLYVQYVQTGGESPKTSNNSSGSSSARPVSGLLPPLREGEVLQNEDVSKSSSTTRLPLTPSALMATRDIRAGIKSSRTSRKEGDYLHPEPLLSRRGKHGALNPYHTSYAPVSAQDSELQSLSSDALTDDTMSLTDSSVDGRDVGGKKWKRGQRAMHRSAAMNRVPGLPTQQHIPRTERAPKDRNIAETDPQKFAAMLIERLEKVYEEQENMRRMEETINSIEMTDEEESMPPPMMMRDIKNISSASLGKNVSVASLENRKNVSTTSMGSLQHALFATAMASGTEEDENAQSILEEHCSRIWDNSSNQTPSRSPGRSPDRGHRRIPLVPPPNIPASVLKNYHHKRKDKDSHTHSMLSFDSGVGGEDKSGVYIDQDDHNNKYVYHHHHHHHHHNKDAKNKSMMEYEAQRRGMSYYMSDSMIRGHTPVGHQDTSHTGQAMWDDRGRSKDARRSNAKKNSDSSSNIDSGVSIMQYDMSSPTKDKVLAWMMENEKLSSDRSTQYSTDGSDRSSHKRSSHKSSSSTTPMPHRQSSSKKASVSFHGSSRSASLDRSGHHSHSMVSQDYLHAQQMAQVMPSQPIIQDPSMPLLNPPNPTTQLEEAKRRLLEDEKNRIMSKSKSFSGASSKDRRMAPPFAPPPRSLPVKQGGSILDHSTEDSSSSSRSERKSRKPSSSAPTTPAAGEVTVVGYYFCGEPIPYRTTIPGKTVTLTQFKQLITKRGNYRYFFKKASDEFDSGVILEEVTDDSSELPLWEGKVVGKVEKIE